MQLGFNSAPWTFSVNESEMTSQVLDLAKQNKKPGAAWSYYRDNYPEAKEVSVDHKVLLYEKMLANKITPIVVLINNNPIEEEFEKEFAPFLEMESKFSSYPIMNARAAFICAAIRHAYTPVLDRLMESIGRIAKAAPDGCLFELYNLDAVLWNEWRKDDWMDVVFESGILDTAQDLVQFANPTESYRDSVLERLMMHASSTCNVLFMSSPSFFYVDAHWGTSRDSLYGGAWEYVSEFSSKGKLRLEKLVWQVGVMRGLGTQIACIHEMFDGRFNGQPTSGLRKAATLRGYEKAANVDRGEYTIYGSGLEKKLSVIRQAVSA